MKERRRDNTPLSSYNNYPEMDKFVEIFSDIFYDITSYTIRQKHSLYNEYEYILEDGWWALISWIRDLRIDEYDKGNIDIPNGYQFNIKTSNVERAERLCKSCGQGFKAQHSHCVHCGDKYTPRKYK